jgi:hypothetical protein
MKGFTVRIGLLAAVVVAAAGMASASTCSSLSGGSLQTVITAGSCTWLTADGITETFSNFNFSDAGAGAFNASGVVFNFTNTVGTATITLTDFLTLHPIVADGSNQQNQIIFSYQMSNGGAALDAINGFGAALSASAAGDGSVNFFKFDNLGHSTGAACSPVCSASPQVTFAGVNSLTITDLVNINSGSGAGSGSASLTSYSNVIDIASVVPEPSTLLMLGGGLLTMGLVRRRVVRR